MARPSSGSASPPISPSDPSGSPTSPKRSSLTHQLPLPSSLTASPVLRPAIGVGGFRSSAPSSAVSSLALSIPHSLTTSVGMSGSRIEALGLNSPTSPRYHGSTTHAGGIQPSASFFRPSKPIDQQTANHPLSPASAGRHNVYLNEFDHSGNPNLRRLSASSEDSTRGPDSLSMTEENVNNTLRGVKQSREPLLPIGERPTPLSSRPSTSRENGVSGSTHTPGHTRSPTASNIVRNSLEIVFNLRRGMSFDSMRKVAAQSAIATRNNSESMTKRISEEPVPIELQYSSRKKSSSVNSARSRSPSPTPSFLPSPPEQQHPPLNAVPIINPDTKKPFRNHELHPSRNRFFFNGRVIMGGDTPWTFIIFFSIVLTIAGVWFGTTCIWWWNNKSPAVAIIVAYMALIVISSMLITAFSDPGILPRNLDPEPPYPDISPVDGVRVPMPRDLKVRSDVVRVKYCPTCKTYRPPRSSHCKMCDNCVDGCDHHCQWVNNCIGHRNYTSFFVLLFSAILTLILIICTTALHIFFLTRQEHTNFKHSVKQGQAVGSLIAFCLSIIIFWPVAALLSYHMRLLLLNITTIEQIRNQAHKTLVPGPAPPNPFSHGSWRKNLLAILCRPVGFSWLDPAGIATEDNRKINPGFSQG